MCAAPLVLPQISRLSVTELMVSVANGFDSEVDRSMTLWWIWVTDIDEEGSVEGAESSLRWADERDVIVITPAALGMAPASRFSSTPWPVTARLWIEASSPVPKPESAGLFCAAAFLRVNANLRFGAEALRISCRVSLRDFTAYQADTLNQRRLETWSSSILL